MYSNKSDYDYGQRRPQSNRRSKPWASDDRREEIPRNSTRDNYDKYPGDGRNWTDRLDSSEYSETFAREYSSDTDWRKKSASSRERSSSEKRRRTLDEDDQYRYPPEPEDSYRQSQEKYSQRNKEFKSTASVEESYGSRKTPEDSRYNQHQDELHYSQYKEDSHFRHSVTEYYQDRDSRERSRSPERRRSPMYSKSYTALRPRSDSFSRDHEEHNHNRNRFSLNGSGRLPEPSHRRLSPPPPPPPPPPPSTAAAAAAAAGEKKMSKGFQRFLDVLNMGVNMETLTQIVTQGSPDANVSQTTSPPYDPGAVGPRQQNTQYWPQAERSHETSTSQQSTSYSSNGNTTCLDNSLENPHFERKLPSPTTDGSSFDVEHKRREVHDVLQAIGIKLGFEELGQMSNRIQERLYGKKPTDSTPSNRKEDEEREKRRHAYVPKRRSRSSSGSSSSDSYEESMKSHSYDAHWKDMDRKYSYHAASNARKPSPLKYLTQVNSQTTHHRPNPEPCPAPMSTQCVPPPSPMVNCPPSPYPNLPPNLPPVMPNMFMPQPPPYVPPYPQTPPVLPPNVFPPALPVRPPFRRHPYLNLLMVPPSDYSNYLNVQQTKNERKATETKRRRYLQEIPTKQ